MPRIDSRKRNNLEREETQRQTMEVAVLQTKKIAELEAKLEQQLANIATSSDSSIRGRIPATIDTSNNGSTTGDRTTNSNVTKEEIMQMFTQFQKNFQQGQYTEITTPAPKGNKKSKGKHGKATKRRKGKSGPRSSR